MKYPYTFISVLVCILFVLLMLTSGLDMAIAMSAIVSALAWVIIVVKELAKRFRKGKL